jgi:hypothetical protein
MASSIEATGDSLVVPGAGPHPILASDLAQQGPTTTAGSTSLRAAIPCTIKTPRTGGASARLPQSCHSPGTRADNHATVENGGYSRARFRPVPVTIRDRISDAA